MLHQATVVEGFWFEVVIIISMLTLVILTLIKYFQKNKNQLTLLLFMVFSFYAIAVIFSWLSKYMTIYTNAESLMPADAGYWFVRRILDFRVSFVFVAIALYLSYVLRVKLFQKEISTLSRVMHAGFAIATIGLSLFLYEEGAIIFDVVVFAVVLLFQFVVYIVFMARSIEAYKNVPNPSFKGAFSSLAIMAFAFILIFVNFLLDRIVILMTGTGFTPFYFAAWICAVVGIVSAYFGYIHPRRS